MKKPISVVPEDVIYDACHEHIAPQIIGIFDRRTGEWGTGTAIKVNGRAVIVTAGHVLKDVNPNYLSFALRKKKRINHRSSC